MASQIVGFTSPQAQQNAIASGRISAQGASALPNNIPDAMGGNAKAPTTTTTPVVPQNALGTTNTQGTSGLANGQTATKIQTPIQTPAGTGANGTPPVTGTPNNPGMSTTQTSNTPPPPSPQAQGFANAQASGKTAPQTPGDAMAGVSQNMPSAQNQTTVTTPPAVANFFDPNTNPQVADQIKAIQDIISPPQVRDQIAKETNQLLGEQNQLSDEKLQMMNIKNIMSGTQQDIRDEITKANGFATNSQVLALTTARNSTLLTQQTQLQEQMTITQQQISNDTTMLASDKATASQEATQRMGILDHLQTANDQVVAAQKDGLKTIIGSVGASGLYNGLMNTDPSGQSVANAESALGLPPGGLSYMAQNDTTQLTKNLDIKIKELSIKKTQQDLNNANGVPDPTKAKQGNQPSAPGYNDQGVKYNTTNASQEIIDNWNKQNVWSPGTKEVPPQYYNSALSSWVKNGLSAADFKAIFGGYQATNLKANYN